jgi:hypothetical protein
LLLLLLFFFFFFFFFFAALVGCRFNVSVGGVAQPSGLCNRQAVNCVVLQHIMKSILWEAPHDQRPANPFITHYRHHPFFPTPKSDLSAIGRSVKWTRRAGSPVGWRPLPTAIRSGLVARPVVLDFATKIAMRRRRREPAFV